MRDLELLTGHVIGVLTSSILLKTDTIEMLLKALLRELASVKSTFISDVRAISQFRCSCGIERKHSFAPCIASFN